MEELQGVIQSIEPRKVNTQWGAKDTVNFTINGDTFSGGFKKWNNVNVGDEVFITYETTAAGYRNIKGLTVVAAGSGGPVPIANTAPKSGSGAASGGKRYRANGEEGGFPLHPLCYERALDRRNALTAAADLAGAAYRATADETHLNKEAIVEVARYFEAYTTGDLDAAEARLMAGEES
jgi:hypothetical protein